MDKPLDEMSLDELICNFFELDLKFLRADDWGPWMAGASWRRAECKRRILEWKKC